MKRFMLSLSMVSAMLLLGACSGDEVKETPKGGVSDYEVSDEDFPNPERGFAVSVDPPWPDKVT